ncbi:DEAD/DEAH box helicase, partial [Mediterraneibacter gnavus]
LIYLIESYNKLGDGIKAIPYCAGVNHSKKVCEEFNSAGIKAVHIDGSMNKTERKKIMDLYRSGYYTVLCNANIISEGITLPNASIGLLLR